jgi:hypothetical protein
MARGSRSPAPNRRRAAWVTEEGLSIVESTLSYKDSAQIDLQLDNRWIQFDRLAEILFSFPVTAQEEERPSQYTYRIGRIWRQRNCLAGHSFHFVVSRKPFQRVTEMYPAPCVIWD